MAGHAHHKESFVSKYVFSQDHKMISKQFLITAVFMGIIAVMLSVFFRLQLGWPGESFGILDAFLGKWAPDGVLDRNAYLALVTIHGTIMVFFVLTGGLSGTFSNLLIPLQIGARDMASGFLNMLSYWFFLASSIIMISSLFVEGGAASGGWTVYPPLSALQSNARFWTRNDTLAHLDGSICSFFTLRWFELHRNNSKLENQRNEDDEIASYDLGILSYSNPRGTFLPCSRFGCCSFDHG